MEIDNFQGKSIFFGQVLKEIRFPKNRFFFRTGPPWTSQVPETGSRFFFRRNIDSRFGVDFLFDGMLESRFRLDFLFDGMLESRFRLDFRFDGKLEIRFWLDFLCDGALEFGFRQDFMSDGVLEPSLGCFSYVPEDQSRWKEEVGATGGGIGWSLVSATSLLRIVYVQGTLSCFM